MAKIQIENVDSFAVRRQNKVDKDNKVVGIESYSINVKGQGDTVVLSLQPQMLHDALEAIIRDEVATRLEGLRLEVDQTMKDAGIAFSDARQTFNERARRYAAVFDEADVGCLGIMQLAPNADACLVAAPYTWVRGKPYGNFADWASHPGEEALIQAFVGSL